MVYRNNNNKKENTGTEENVTYRHSLRIVKRKIVKVWEIIS